MKNGNRDTDGAGIMENGLGWPLAMDAEGGTGIEASNGRPS